MKSFNIFILMVVVCFGLAGCATSKRYAHIQIDKANAVKLKSCVRRSGVRPGVKASKAQSRRVGRCLKRKKFRIQSARRATLHEERIFDQCRYKARARLGKPMTAKQIRYYNTCIRAKGLR